MTIENTFHFFSFREAIVSDPEQTLSETQWSYHSIPSSKKTIAVACGVFTGLVTALAVSPLAGIGVGIVAGLVVGVGVCWLIGQLFKNRAIFLKLHYQETIVPFLSTPNAASFSSPFDFLNQDNDEYSPGVFKMANTPTSGVFIEEVED